MTPEQQHQIDLGYEQGIDPTPYADPIYNPEQMCQYRIALVDGLDITPILNPKFNPEQLFQLREGLISSFIKYCILMNIFVFLLALMFILVYT